MATATAAVHGNARGQAGLPALTTQERFTCRSLLAIVADHDYWRTRAEALERDLPGLYGYQRKLTLRALLEARQREEAAIRDLRDGVVHLAGVAGHAWPRGDEDD